MALANGVTRWQQARAKMLMQHMFFATLLLNTKCSKSTSIPTAATDYKQIWYNEKFIDGLPDVETAMFVAAHELMHIILQHGLRRKGRDPKKWNIAADFAINLMLKKSKMKIWEFCYCDDKYEGMTAEQIYDARAKDPPPKDPSKSRGTQGHGKKDDGMDDDGIGDDINVDTADMTEEEIEQVEHEIKKLVAQAAHQARMAGKLPGHLKHLVDGIANPPLPWYEILRPFLAKAAPIDESWVHRNRRFRDCYLPSRHSEAMGEVVIIGDTSGSLIGSNIFTQIACEIDMMMELVKPERVRVIWADDAEVQLEEIFLPGEPLALNPKGGGGTDMRRPLKHVEQFEPIVVILVTDGYTPWPDSEPPFPLIVLCNTSMESPVGTTIHI